MTTPAAEREHTTKPRLAIEVAELFPPQGQWKEEHYFALPDTNRIVELSKGVLIMPPHPTESHQTALQEFYARLREFVQERDLGKVYSPYARESRP